MSEEIPRRWNIDRLDSGLLIVAHRQVDLLRAFELMPAGRVMFCASLPVGHDDDNGYGNNRLEPGQDSLSNSGRLTG